MGGEERKRSTPGKPKLPWRHRLLLVGFGLALLLVAELGLRLAGIGAASAHDPLAGFTGARLFERAAAQDGAPVYRVSAAFRKAFNAVEFPVAKSADTFRVFCFGGSSTFGYPTGAEIAFPRWLAEWLAALDPARRFEVLNVGGISYASHRVRLLLHEVLEHAPDLIVIYSGHNEFVERNFYAEVLGGDAARGRLARLDRTLGRWSRLYASTRGALAAARESAGPAPRVGESDMGFEVVVRRRTGRNTPATRAEAVAGYRANLEGMVDLCRARGVEIVLLTTPPNLRDWAPDGSAHRDGLAPAELEAFDRALAEGMRDLDTGDPEAAAARLRAAVAIDGEHAEAWYRLAQALEASGDAPGAAEAYSRARDMDQLPIRALAALEDAVRAVGAERGVPVVDVTAAFAAEAEDGLIGSALVMDYVHPTVFGHQVIARELARWMAGAGLAGDPAGLAAVAPEVAGAQARERVALEARAEESPTEQLNRAFALRNEGRLEEAIMAARRAAELRPRWATARHALATLYYESRMPEEAERAFRKAIELDPEDDRSLLSLGVLLMQTGRAQQAEVFLRRATEAAPERADAHATLGKLLGALGEPDEAEHHLREALRIDDTLADTHNDLGVVYARSGRADLAVAQYRRVVELRPADPKANLTLGAALQRAGQPREAAAAYERAVASAPEDVQAVRALAWLRATCADAGQRDGARALVLAERLLALTGREHPLGLAVLAAAQAESGRFEEAVRTATRAREGAGAAGLEPLVAELDRQLAAYRAGRPFRE